MNKIKIAIIEDIDDIRNNLQDYFEQQEEIDCILVSNSVETFFEQIDNYESPDLILSDIGLPGMNGIEGMKMMKSQWPDVDIIMLTVFKDNDKIFKSICAGATGYLVKDTPLSEIKKAILEISNGGSYMSPSIARKVLEYFSPIKTEKEQLTTKEKQIVTALTEGLSYKLIADKLLISIDTVRFHIKNIYRKLHINSKSELISKVLKGEI
ncbi:MAG: response regulator transcription factor [Bacteroidetes bacterium]|nr:response regulator transcription factor [Bacteroidota bacterium]